MNKRKFVVLYQTSKNPSSLEEGLYTLLDRLRISLGLADWALEPFSWFDMDDMRVEE